VGGLGPIEITADEVLVTETPREGWAVASDGGESVALDLMLDDRLRRAGFARELVRALQEGRKAAGLDVSDRITVWWSSTDPALVATMAEHGDAVAGEVLAVSIVGDATPPDAAVPVASELDVELAILRAAT
jgi:isoleucyl-tRNA synthetase